MNDNFWLSFLGHSAYLKDNDNRKIWIVLFVGEITCSYVCLLLFSSKMAAHSMYIRITHGELRHLAKEGQTPEAKKLMAERIRYEIAYQVRVGGAPVGEAGALPVSDVRLRDLGVTRAAPSQADTPGGAAEEEDSDSDVFQDAESQIEYSDDSDKDARIGRSREECLFLTTGGKRASPSASTAMSRRMAADRIMIDESKGPVHLAAEYWVNPKTGDYQCPVAACAGRNGGHVEFGQWRSLVRHFEVNHNDLRFMFFCNGKECIFS